jgi:GalNAc-alpha-(1->4)-GalNAc-alpha-(1->3)-diNAcBac-PP-undecaprenol alpha-1,4-N-acetyl-D-galactosaminyltransferase
MRITLTIPSLGAGGAERVLILLANSWASKGWKVTLLSLNDEDWTSFYDLDARLKWVRLGLMKEARNTLSGLGNNYLRIRALARAIHDSRPQVVISFIDTMNVLVLMAAMGLNVPVVISERTDPTKHKLGKVWRILRALSYPSAGRLVVQNQSGLDFFKPMLGEQIRIIPNPILPAPEKPGETPCLPHGTVVMTAGRLSHEKGCDLLIRAFAMLAGHYPDWRLLILGEGPQRSQLEGLIAELEMSGRVSLPGRVKNPYDYYRKADLFVLPSRYEGLPNSLCEAMACGMPIVAAGCSPGVIEVVQNGVNGLLAEPENVDSLAEAMGNLMGDKDRRDRLGQQARLSVEPYNMERVTALWENLIRELTTR